MPAIRRRWSTVDVRALMDESRAWPRYELIGGELLVTPAASSTHQLIVLEIAARLHAYVEREPVGIVFTSPADLELREGTITQPDVFVVPADIQIAGAQLEWTDIRSLLLAVEVISPSSVRTDRVEKRDFYLESSVDEYWIVDIDARMVERWTPARERPDVLRDRVEWLPRGAVKPLVIDLLALFDGVVKKLSVR